VDVIRYPDDPRPTEWVSPVLALGNFDGLHRGHMTIVRQVVQSAEAAGRTPVLLTFDPHPARVVRPDGGPRLLMTTAQKIEVLRESGIRGIVVVRFTRELSQWPPERFVDTVLVRWLQTSEVWVGANFLFGRDRSGNFPLLREEGARHGFAARKVDSVQYAGQVVSSTRIRGLVAVGDVSDAAVLLGRRYSIDGTVVHGDGRGRTLGFPTANLEPADQLLPARGVYATVARVGEEWLPSVTNVGVHPTVGAAAGDLVEVHLLRGGRDIYGEAVRLEFASRLRGEQAFPSVEALRQAIAADCARAMAFLASN